MIRAGLLGLGKMGISHCSIINAHFDIDLVAVCDTSKLVLSALKKYASFECFSDYKKMIDQCKLDCIVIATPTIFHAEMVNYSLERGIHVFCEKPFCLSAIEGSGMVELAEKKNLVNQVGYHNRFLGTFGEVKRIVDEGIIGDVYHFFAEAYGPVVLKEKGSTWRSTKSEGGGCLYDYAAHVIDLINYLIGRPDSVAGTVLKKIYSRDVDDAVYSTLLYNDGITGQLAVNWSDESYRKMSTQITILGTNGKIVSDALECRIYIRDNRYSPDLSSGWNMKYITDLTKPVWFNLRGEEYSAQIDYFFQCVKESRTENINSFRSAMQTDEVIDLLKKDFEKRDN